MAAQSDQNTAQIPDQYRASFDDAGKKYGIKSDFLTDLAAIQLQQAQIKDGQPPAMDQNLRAFIAKENNLKVDLNDLNTQWQIYALYLAEEVADYRNATKALYTIDFGSGNPKTLGAAASGLMSQAVNHGDQYAKLNHTSTDTEYRPSNMGIAMIEKFEGFRADTYTLNGIKHIGFGESSDKNFVAKGHVTREEAEQQLGKRLEQFGGEIVKKWPGFLKLPQSVQDACVSYAYNCGVGGFMKSQACQMLKDGKILDGAEAIANGIHTAGGVDNAGLVARRKIESQFALMDVGSVASAPKLADKPTNTANLGTKSDMNTPNPNNAGRLTAGATPPAPQVAPAAAPVHKPTPAAAPTLGQH